MNSSDATSATVPGTLEELCRAAFEKEDSPQTGRIDVLRFRAALRNVFARLRPIVPQPNDDWFDKVYQSYAPKCGGNGISLRAMVDAARQYQKHHEARSAGPSASGKQCSDSNTSAPRAAAPQQVRPQQPPDVAQQLQHELAQQLHAQTPERPPQVAPDQFQKKQIVYLQQPQPPRADQNGMQGVPQPGPQQLLKTPMFPMNAQGYALQQQVQAQQARRGDPVELASAVMFPMKRGANAVFEQYLFDKKIGEGSFGSVSIVTHKTTGQRRACKRVEIATAQDWRLVETEIQLLLCEGGNLLEGFARHGSEEAALSCLRQILGATAYCHARGVIHRDLKPDNILYASKAADSAIKIIDFGLADFLQRLRAASTGKPMERAGTLVFMAPEMIISVGDGSYGEKVDVWAIGCILFMLITGAHPFWSGRNSTSEEVKDRIVRGRMIDHPNWKVAPQAVQHLTMQMLTIDPQKRVSASDALRHPWLKDTDGKAPDGSFVPKAIPKSVFDGLLKYQASSKLKRAVWKLLAKEADESRVQKFRDLFRTLDKHQDGFLSRDELIHGMRQCPEFADLTPADLNEIIPTAARDRISCTDFTAAMIARQGFNRAELLNAFRRFDVRKEGKISLAALSDVLKNAGPVSKLEAFKEADVGQDGAIDFEEFCALIRS